MLPIETFAALRMTNASPAREWSRKTGTGVEGLLRGADGFLNKTMGDSALYIILAGIDRMRCQNKSLTRLPPLTVDGGRTPRHFAAMPHTIGAYRVSILSSPFC
jgi:hypothetical protein